jgi:hypothetical protein
MTVRLKVAGMRGMGETIVSGTITSLPHTAIAKCQLTQTDARKRAQTIIGKINCHHKKNFFLADYTVLLSKQ